MKLKEIISWIKRLFGISDKKDTDIDPPFDLKKVIWLGSADPIRKWPETIKLIEFRDNATWSVDGVIPHWAPNRINGKDCVGTIMFFFKHNGRVYGQPTEFFQYGQINQDKKIFRSERDGKQLWDEPFRYQTRYPNWVCLCGLNWLTYRGTKERSNIVELKRV